MKDKKEEWAEIAKQYENLSLKDKIGIIAQAFNGTSGKIETFPCKREWCGGTSDIFIKIDNERYLYIGNRLTPKAKTAKVQSEYVNEALVQYNPVVIAAKKEAAIAALRVRETKDNEVATQRGLKPYTLLNVEFNDGIDKKSRDSMGWYYVTLAVDGKIHAHMETRLNFDIADGKVSENSTWEDYFTAGGLEEDSVDYVFNNVGFSTTSGMYTLRISDDVRARAEKALAERKKTQFAATITADVQEGQQSRTT